MRPAAKRAPRRSPRGSARDGFVIVAVLWILIALATLASIYSIYIGNSALALSVLDDGLQADALVSTSLELTAYRLSVPLKEERPTRGGFGFRQGRANVVVNFSSENARIDLNAAPKDMLAGFFAAIGAQSENAGGYADRIIGWRTAPKRGSESNGSGPNEDDLYRTAGLTYLPRGAPFAHLSELWLVHGLPPLLIARALPFVTIYSGRPEINVFDAPPEVVAALPGMTPARLNSLLDRRESSPREPEALPLLLGPDQKGATAEGSDAVRVRVRMAFDNGRKTASEAVILLGSSDAPYRVLSWRDDADASSDPPQAATRRR
jgi:general secretion pathway protein K